MIDIEEREYRQLRKLGQKLHIPVPEAFLELEVRDQDGKVIQHYKQRSHSWVRNVYNAIFSVVAAKDMDDVTFGAGLLSLKDTAGSVLSGASPFGYGAYSVDGTADGLRAPASEDAWGILVGSGVGAESFEEFVLQTPIAEGTGAGQLSYIVSEEHSITYIPLTLKNALARYFNNNSGGVVDVKEVALVTYAREPQRSHYLMSRDLLGATVSVPNTGQLKVTYTVQLTYPE